MPITIVPLIVVALRISVPASIGILPRIAITIIAKAPTRTGFFNRSRPARMGRSLPTNLESEANVESIVEAAEEVITASMANDAAKPSDLATRAGTLPLGASPSSRACTPMRLKAKIARKPSAPDQQQALSITFASEMNPRSVSTGS